MKRNTETLQRYLEERQANDMRPSTLEGDNLVLRSLAGFLGDKAYEDASREDLICFVNSLSARLKPSTLHLLKAKVKHFYAWLFNCDPREYPSMVKWMRTNNPQRFSKTKGDNTSFNPEDLLTDEDVLAMIDACDHPRDQALISVLYETGAEAVELLAMKVKSVFFDQAGARITLEGTGGKRALRVVDSVPYIQAWLNVHTRRRDPEAPLWLVVEGAPKGMGYERLYQILKDVQKKARVQKPVSPRYFRHACLTKMAKVLPEQKLKQFAGWTPSSQMASVYVHLSGKDLDEDILRSHGKAPLEEERLKPSPLRPVECPRCKKENPATAQYCLLCGMTLTKDAAIAQEERKTHPLDQIIASEREEFLALIKKASREEAQHIVETVLEPLKEELKQSHREITKGLREVERLRKEVDERLHGKD